MSSFPTNTTANKHENNLYPLSLVIPFTIINVIIFVAGVIGNIGTCVVIVKNKELRSATNYYLFSLACSDMLLLLSGLPLEMYNNWSPDTYLFGEVFCVIQSFAAETSAYATVLTITAFTVERYLAICHPFFTQTMSKLTRAIKYICAIWITALILAVPQAAQFGVIIKTENSTETSVCSVKNAYFKYAFEISTFVIFVGPMTLITILYVLIVIKLRGSTYLASHRYSNSSVTSQKLNSKFILRTTTAQRRVVNMLIAVVIAFFVCWAPFHAQRILAVYLASAPTESQEYFFGLYRFLMYTSGMLYYISTTINPVLYHIMSKKFRKAFKETYKAICCGRFLIFVYGTDQDPPHSKRQKKIFPNDNSRTMLSEEQVSLSQWNGENTRSEKMTNKCNSYSLKSKFNSTFF